MPRVPAAVPFAILALMVAGCSNVYTRHMSESYKDNRIEGKVFAVLPVIDIDYNPPSNCMGGGSGDGAKYEQPWLDAVTRDLKSTFKTQTFRSYSAESLKELQIEPARLYSSAADEVMTMGVKQYQATGGGTPKVVYEAARPAGRVASAIRLLRERDSVDYVILLVQPKMTGEVQTNHGYAGPNMNAGVGAGMHGAGPGMGGGGTTTTYTSDVQFGVWSTETGELAYASGAISASSGFCFFVSPQQGSINGTSRDLSAQLKALIASLLRERHPGAVELGYKRPSAE